MYTFSLVLGFGWMGLGVVGALASLYRAAPLPLAILVASLASLLIDFTGGSIVAMAFGPIVVLVASHAIFRALQRPPAPVPGTPLPAPTDAPEPGPDEGTKAATPHVLLLYRRSHRSPLWLAHNGHGVVLVTPTCPERAKSGLRVKVIRKCDGSVMAVT